MYSTKGVYRAVRSNPGLTHLSSTYNASKKGSTAPGSDPDRLTFKKAGRYAVIGGLFAIGGVVAVYALSTVAPGVIPTTVPAATPAIARPGTVTRPYGVGLPGGV